MLQNVSPLRNKQRREKAPRAINTLANISLVENALLAAQNEETKPHLSAFVVGAVGCLLHLISKNVQGCAIRGGGQIAAIIDGDSRSMQGSKAWH